jgi:serine/threonine protein kinase
METGSSATSNSATTNGSGNVAVDSKTRVFLAPKWLGKRVGRFKLLALLGQGAMGRVFRAEDTLMQRHVALKLLPRTVKKGQSAVGVEMLIREARAAASIEHPGAVQIYEINEAGDVYYIAMELLEGGSLRDLVKAAGPLDPIRACLLGAEAAETLAYSHSIGVIHRDVKPANLMLNRAGRCKVVDFGLARVDDPNDQSNFLGESVGTPQFIAPEILTGSYASSASDIYSLGASMWYLLTGRPPFEAATAPELLQKHLYCPVPDLKAIRPEVPQSLCDALYKALEKQPGNRYPSMDQFAKVLRINTIPIAGSASSMEGLAASGIIPASMLPNSSGMMPGAVVAPMDLAPQEQLEPAYEEVPQPAQAEPQVFESSPFQTAGVSASNLSASSSNRRSRPASPFEALGQIEQPSPTEAVYEQIAEMPAEAQEAAEYQEPVAELPYTAPLPPEKSRLGWIIVGVVTMVMTIAAVIACVVLLQPEPPVAPVSSSAGDGTPVAKPAPVTTPPVQSLVSATPAPADSGTGAVPTKTPAGSSDPNSVDSHKPSTSAPPKPKNVAILPLANPGKLKLGDFDDQSEVGKIALEGSTDFSALEHVYTVHGTGDDIFRKPDAFHFVWKKISGNAAIQVSSIRYVVTSSQKWRKAGLMFRQNLDPDSAFVDVVLHGDQSLSLQCRGKKGYECTQKSLGTMKGPTTIQLDRHGKEFIVYLGKPGDKKLAEKASISADMKEPIYVGLIICAHDLSLLDGAEFKDVVIAKK